jgi:stage IV sporulation protein B
LRKNIHVICAALSVFCAVAFGGVAAVSDALPDSFTVVQNRPLTVQSAWPVTAQRTEESVAVAGQKQSGVYEAQIKLLGAVPVKTVQVRAVQETRVIPCGTPFGIKMFAGGALIIGMTDVDTETGNSNPARNAGLSVGDVITRIGERRVTTRQEVAELIENSGGQTLSVTYEHEGQTLVATIQPEMSRSAGEYKAGVWIKDSCAGIGTMTFVTEDGKHFAGLGHAICDADTGQSMPMDSGEIVPVELIGVTKGARGAPGELKGYFSSAEPQGTLLANGETGVFGLLNRVKFSSAALPVAMKQEVVKGGAQVLTTVDGAEPRYYSVEIERINYDEKTLAQNMVVRITDPALLEKTGGIVQGMSGSPIVQNGRLIGAVTHVFVNDPTRGYAIFAENMVNTINDLQTQENKAA